MFHKKNEKKAAEGGAAENIETQKKRKPKSKKKKKLIIAGVIILVLVVGVVIISKLSTGGEVAQMVSTGSVEKMDIEEVVSINGTIQGSESADVVSALNYKVLSILVKEGDKVSKNQVLAVLDADTLQDEYDKSVRALQESKFKYEASKQLYDEGAISEEEYLAKKNTYENDKATVNANQLSDKVNVKSPISGTVTRVNVNLGNYANDIQDEKPMFVIEDLANLKMDVKISEFDINSIKDGQNVTITADVLGDDSVQGVVSRISPTGELKDASSKEMVVPVQIDVTNGNSDLIAGVTAKAKILIQKKENVMSIPIDSILEDPETGKSFVMALNEKTMTIKKVPVELGLEGDFNIEVISGKLSEGDKIVLSPTFDMTDGMVVTTLPAQ